MIFDGDCRFCRRWIARWRHYTKSRVRYVPFQKLGEAFPQVSRKACRDSVQFVDPRGRIFSGADAVVRLFDLGMPGGHFARVICAHPPIIWMLRLGYRLVARYRQFFSRLTSRSSRKSLKSAL
jgi:predicted DCC family thiol-disulfide oxidoreductase YuxK